MKRIVSLSVSLMLTLLLMAGLFSVTAFAITVTYPMSVEISYGQTETTFDISYTGLTYEYTDFGGSGYRDVTLKNENGETLPAHITFSDYPANNCGFPDGTNTHTITIQASDWESAEAGTTYTGTMHWIIRGESTATLDQGEITLTAVIPADDDSSEESSEESSEPEESSEESSEPEESSTTEEESSTTEEESSTTEEESSTTEEESSAAEEESSAAESESESSQSSKTSKPSNPGKPDTLTMGGSTGGAADSGKPAPDTGFGNAPLIALGVAAMAGLAVLAFRKK